jgi:hypothetical protein
MFGVVTAPCVSLGLWLGNRNSPTLTHGASRGKTASRRSVNYFSRITMAIAWTEVCVMDNDIFWTPSF